MVTESPGPTAVFFVTTCSHSLNCSFLSQPFVTQGRPGRLKLSTNKRQVEDKVSVPENPIESCLVTRCAVITQIHSFPLERSGSVIRKGLYARRHSIKDPKESLYFRRGILIYTRLKDSH